MCTPKWRSILVHWINCLQDNNIKELKELTDGTILLAIIRQLVSTKTKNETFNNVEEFFQKKYVTFDWPKNSICDGDESTITTAVTLLLHYACVRSNNVDIRKTMCNKLAAVDQQTIMHFNKFIMKNSLDTSEDLRLAIVYACSEDSVSIEGGEDELDSQAMSEATPPAVRLLHDQRLEIRRLRSDLDAERFDRTYLQDEVKRLQDATNKLTSDREKSQKHISLLKSLLESARSPESPKGQRDIKTSKENTRLSRQLQELEDRLVNVQTEMDDMTKERDSLKVKLESMRLEKDSWFERASEQSVRTDQALEQARTQREQVSALQEQVADLRAHLLRSHDHHDNSAMLDTDEFDSSARFRSAADFSAISEDLCSNVVEVQLSEQRSLCEGLQKKVEAVNDELARMTNEKDIVVEANEMLCNKIKTFESDHADLENIVRNQQALLLAQTEHLHTMSLNVQSNCENEINKILIELNHLLTDPKTQIVDNFQDNVKLLLRINNAATQLVNELQAGNDEKNVVISHLRRTVTELNESLQTSENDKKYLSEGVTTIMNVNNMVINKECLEKIDALRNRIDVLNKLIDVLSVKTKSVFDGKNLIMKNLQNELEIEKAKSKSLEVECEKVMFETDEKIKTLKNLIIVKQNNISELEEKQCNLETYKRDLENKLEAEIEEKKCVEISFTNAEEKIKKMETDILKLEEEQRNLESIYEKNKRDLEYKLEQEIDGKQSVENSFANAEKRIMQMKKDIELKENNILKLEEEHRNLESLYEKNIHRLNLELEEVINEKNSVQISFAKAQSKMDEIEKDNELKENHILKLEEEQSNLEKEYRMNMRELEYKLEQVIKEKRSVEISFSNAKDKVEKMEKDSETQQNNILRLEAENNSLESNIQELDNKLGLEMQHLRDLATKLEETAEKNVLLHSCITEKDYQLKVECDHLQSSIDNLSDLLEKETLHRKSLELECQKLKDNIEILEKDITIKESDISKSNDEIFELKGKLNDEISFREALKLECEDLEEKIETLNTELQCVKSNLEQEMDQKIKLEINHKEAEKKAEALQKSSLARENYISELEREKSKLESSMKDLEINLEREIQEKHIVCNLAFEEAEEKIRAVKNEIMLEENHVTELKEECANLETQLKEAQYTLNIELQKSQTAEEELTKSKDKVDKVEKEITLKDKELSKIKEEHVNLKSHVKNIQESNEKLNSDLMEMGEQMGQLTCAFEDEKSARSKYIVKTEKCIQEKNKNITELTDSLKLEKQSNNTLKNNVSELETKIVSVKETILILDNEVLELQDFKKKYDQIFITLEQERKDFFSKESALRTNISVTESNLSEMTDEKNKFKECLDDMVTVLSNEHSLASQTIENLNKDLNSSRNIVTVISQEKDDLKNELGVAKKKFQEIELVLKQERNVNIENVGKLNCDIATQAQRHNESLEILRADFIEMKNMYEILSDEYGKQKYINKIIKDEKIMLENDIEKCRKLIAELEGTSDKNLEQLTKNEKDLSIRKNIVNEYIKVTCDLNNQVYKLQEEMKKMSIDLEMEKNLLRETEEKNETSINKLISDKEQLKSILQQENEDQCEAMKHMINNLKLNKNELDKKNYEMSQNIQKLQQLGNKHDTVLAELALKEKRIFILNNLVTEFRKQVGKFESSLNVVNDEKLTLVKDLENSKSEIIQLNSVLDEKMRQNNDLNMELEQMRCTHDKLLSMFVYDKEDMARVSQENVNLEKHVKLTEDKCDELLMALENEQKCNIELKMKLETESIHLTDKNDEKNRLINEIKQLRENSEVLLEKIQREGSNWNENVTNLEMNLASKEGVLSTVLQEKNEICTELDNCKQDYEFNISVLSKQVNEKNNSIMMLEKELTKKEETLQQIITEIADLRRDYEKISNILENVKEELAIKADLLSENNSLISQLKKKNHELIVTIEEERQSKTELVSKLEGNVTSKMEILTNLTNENELLKHFKVKYDELNLFQEKNVIEHEKDLSELKVSFESKLEAEVNMRKDIESKYEKLEINYSTNVSELNELLEDVKRHSEEKAAQIDTLEELLDERTSEINSLLGKLDALTEKQDQLEDGNVETIHDYQEQLFAKTEELNRLETEIGVIVQEKNSMENNFNEINNEVLKLRKEMNEKNQDVESVSTQNHDLRLKYEQLIDNKENEIQSFKEQNENLTEEINSLRLCNKNLEAEVEKQLNYLQTLNAGFEECQIDVENLKTSNSNITATNSTNCEKIHVLNSKIVLLEKDVGDLVKEKEDILNNYKKMQVILDDKDKILSSFIDKFNHFIEFIGYDGKNYNIEKEVDAIVELVERYFEQLSEFSMAANINDSVESTTCENSPCLLGIKLKKVSSHIINIKKENLEKQKESFDRHLEETCKMNDLSEKINTLNDSLFKRNNEIEEFLKMLQDKDNDISTLKNKLEMLSNELSSFKEEQSATVDNLETVICEKNSQITNFHREVTYLKTIIAESENKMMDVNKELKVAREKLAAVNKEKNDAITYLQQQSAKLQEKLTRKEDGNETIKLSAKLQSLVHQWNIENRNAVALQELTHLSNITNDENSAFDKRSVFDKKNSTFKSESGVTLDQLEALLESSVKRDKLSSDRINVLQQEREHLMLQNKSFKNENESLKKAVAALKERSQLNENAQSMKCLNELSVYFKTFSSVRNTYKLKLQKINSIQKLIRKEMLQIKSVSPESVTSLEKQYLINMEEIFAIIFLYADWSELCVDHSISNLNPSHSSLNVSDVQNITLEIQLDQLVTTFSKLFEEFNQLRMGVGNCPPVPSRRQDNSGVPGGQNDPNEVHRRVSEVRAEYEDKLTRMKAKMKQLYQEQIAVYKERQREELSTIEKELSKERKALTERTKAYEQHVASLTDELWKVGEKLLVERNESEWLRKKGQSSSLLSLQNTSSATAHTQRGHGRPSRGLDTQSLQSVRESEKSESGGLHMSDEEGEVFDNRWLKELSCTPKAGAGQTNNAFDNQRYSELRWRNSLCPPHLKSSYPAETQFHTTTTYAEQDIKSETERRTMPIRKEVGITAYKKPGPPTPSKNAGRLSATDSELRESIRSDPDLVAPKKNATPSRLKSLLGMGTSRTEHDNTTPKSRRLSIFRKNR